MSLDLSIVIPVYNSENTIVECVKSVVDECVKNGLKYEIILVNDGSTDKSQEIIEDLQRQNHSIKCIAQENSGPSSARNNGLQNALGKYIALNDSDDIWLEGKLKLQLDYLRNHPETDLLTCQYAFKSKFNKEMKTITFEQEAFHNYFSTQTVIFKNIIKDKTFPLDMKYSEDMRFFISVMEDFNCSYYPEVVARNVFNKHHFGDSGLSSNLEAMEKGELSNIYYMFKKKKISLVTLIFAYSFSYIKYIRRIFITKLIKRRQA